ncbi:MAG: metallophosphoesterase family protein [Gammaproteobacteria bacterium]|nr:metallophosphoesterase family protein [Gammaproteobacteria bacterium]
MKICILSDSHDRRDLLAAAVADAVDRGVEAVFHGGDVVAPSTLSVLQPFGLPVHVVHGNNTGDLYTMNAMARRKGSIITYHGNDMDLELGGRRIFMVHYPHYARGMAVMGDWDLVCCGHSHRAVVERVATIKGGESVLVDAGTVGGVCEPPTYVLGDLATMEFHIKRVPES